MVKRLKNESYKKSMKESYSDINDDNVWEVFDYVKELLTPDGLVENMARWMGLNDLTKCMQYICRTQGIPVLDEEFEESIRKVKVKKSTGMKENFTRNDVYAFLDTIGGYDDYNGKIEQVMDEFGVDKEEAESYVWSYTSGVEGTGLYDDGNEDDEWF